MIQVGFEVVSALCRGIHQTRAIPPQRFEEGARVTAVLGARILISGIEGAISAVSPEVRAIPEIHQAEDAALNAPQAGCGVALEQTQFLEPSEPNI